MSTLSFAKYGQWSHKDRTSIPIAPPNLMLYFQTEV